MRFKCGLNAFAAKELARIREAPLTVKGPGGSNPSLSALRKCLEYIQGIFFYPLSSPSVPTQPGPLPLYYNKVLYQFNYYKLVRGK
jgi:hypothetical protein